MKRTIQHEIDDRGILQVQGTFSQAGWTTNIVEHDYGRDLNIEVFENRKTTGVTLDAQVKSSAASAYSADRSFVSVTMTASQARYLCLELRTPTLLLHADVTAGRTFWLAPQLDAVLRASVAAAPEGETVTFRIPTANELPTSFPKLRKALEYVAASLAARAITDIPAHDFLGAHSTREERVTALSGLEQKSILLRLSEANSLIREGRAEDAAPHLEQVIRDPASSNEARFSAWAGYESVVQRRLAARSAGDKERYDVLLGIAAEMQKAVRKGPSHWKLYALLHRVATELEAAVHRAHGLFLNRAVGDSLPLALQRGQIARRVNLKYRHSIRLVTIAGRSRHRGVLVRAMLGVPEALSVLAIVQRHEGDFEAAMRTSETALSLCKMIAEIAKEGGDDETLALVVGTASVLMTSENGEHAEQWALGTAETIASLPARQDALFLIERARRRRAGEQFPGDIKTTAQQISDNMEAALDFSSDSGLSVKGASNQEWRKAAGLRDKT